MIGLVTFVYAVVGLLRLTRFDMTAFDAGIFDNVLWRLGNGFDDVSALTGSHHFSDHMSPLLLAAVPIYALIPSWGLPILMVAQAVSVGLVAVAAWLLGEHVGLDSKSGWAVLLVTLLGAGAYNAAVIDIHEVGLAVGPIALTAALALRGTPLRRYWVWPAVAALARIDIAVTVLLIGVLLRRDRPSHSRIAIWIGGVAAIGMTAWLILNPWDGTSFAYHFSHLGIDSATELPGAMFRDPVAALRPLFDPTMWGSVAIWLAGFTALAPIRAAKWILPATPTLAIPVLGSWEQADMSHLHYWHVLLPMLAIAAVLGFASAAALRRRAIYLAGAAVLATWVFMPILKPSFGSSLAEERSAVAFLNEQHSQASVAAMGSLVPHISNRPTVMQLPTPFACPTVPIASFRGPAHAPELVTIPTNLFESPSTPAAATVASTVADYYEQIAVFGDIEVWRLVGDIPTEAYDAVCEAEASENS